MFFNFSIDEATYISDFKSMDKDGDNDLSFAEVKKWVEAKAKIDPNYQIFVANGVPVLKIAHKMASMGSDSKSTVFADKVVDVTEFKILLIQLFAVSVLWSHFVIADDWISAGEELNSTRNLTKESFRLSVRTLTSAFAGEQLTDEEIDEDFVRVDSNNNGSIGFVEVIIVRVSICIVLPIPISSPRIEHL